MKKLLLFVCFAFANMVLAVPTLSNLTVTNVTANTATVNYFAQANCPQGAAVQVNYATNSSFTNAVVVPSYSVFGGQNFSLNISGLAPGTLYFLRLTANTGSSCGVQSAVSATITFTTATAVPTPPAIANISAVATNGTATIRYVLNANNFDTTSSVIYGVDLAGIANVETGAQATGATDTNATVVLSGLQPGTTYYYKIEATNSAGTTTSAEFSFFVPVNQLIASYDFNGTYADITGANPFDANTGTLFFEDRNNNPNSALAILNLGTVATIPGLPYGASARTVSLWARIDEVSPNYNFLFSYGTSTGYYGAYLNPNFLYNYGTGAGSHSVVAPQSPGWSHFVFTYDGAMSRIYKNGALIGTAERVWSTSNNADIFSLGLTENGQPGYFKGYVDDLKIYNYALPDADVASLYNYNQLAVDAVRQAEAVSLSPNPASDRFTVLADAEIQSVQVFTLQGQKVLTAQQNEINTSTLPTGLYLVQVTDQQNRVVTKKLMVKN